jgi:excisionase family DNA binding protein
MTTSHNDYTPPQPLLVRIEEAARLLCLGRSTVYEMIYKGDIPSVKYGSARRIPLAAIEQWIRDHTQHGA